MANRIWHYRSGAVWSLVLSGLVAGSLVPSTGCYSIRNAWLDPTALGAFGRSATMEIRTSLTLEDTPPGIPGAEYPTTEDLIVRYEEYDISPGDTLAIEIYELRLRDIPYQTQALVSSTGYVNLPVLGRVDAAGLTVPQLERRLVNALKDRSILVSPEVTVNPLYLQNATYSVFGIGVSAANESPLRAGTFPIRRPDLGMLEAINQVGGLNEFVTDVYIFRYDEPFAEHGSTYPPSGESKPAEEPAPQYVPGDLEAARALEEAVETEGDNQSLSRSPEQELIEAVVGGDENGEPSETEPPSREIPESLEPDPTQPYIWVNNEFVPNPTYREPSRDTAPSRTPPPAFEAATQAVNWARIAGDTTFRVIRIPADLLRSGDPEANIIVRPGDVLRIVSGEIGVYYVMGQVNRVGAFAFNSEKVTLKAAIAAAGGLSSLAWPDRCTVYRRLGQREQMIQVDLDRIFAGKDPDFYIRRSDIINVGTHPFAPFLQRIRLLTLPNPVSNVGYSFTYARNFADIDSFAVQRNPANEPLRFEPLFQSVFDAYLPALLSP